MTETTLQRLQRHVATQRAYTGNTRPIVLDNGRTISVQASDAHYSVPRDSRGPWTAFEVGTHWDHTLLEPHGNSEPYQGLRVFSYVPADVVAQVIEDNGGFA